MSVTVMITTGPEREALVVSKDAVLVRPDGSTVWVAVAGGEAEAAEVQPVPVTIGVRMPQRYSVEAQTEQGRKLLVPGARVVVEGAERLVPGQQVRIVTLEVDRGDAAGSGGSPGNSQSSTSRPSGGAPGRQES
jgi:hypothetical protein